MEIILNVCLLLFVTAILPDASASSYDNYGSHHGRRYAAYDYDLTTPQYTPDGRLLQVEYATNACIREGSNPIVSVGIDIPGDTGPVIVMATISSPPPSSSLMASARPPSQKYGQGLDTKQNGENEKESPTKESSQRAQFRIIEVPLAASYRRSSIQQPATSAVLVGLSGLLSDATSLLQVAYSHLEEEQRTFGWHRLGLSPVGTSAVDGISSGSTALSLQPYPKKQSQSTAAQPSETVLRLSSAIADECQKHAFGGGLRPFGASLLLAGGDEARVALCETHPNGGWRRCVSDVKSAEQGNTITSPQIMVSGGPVKSQHNLKSLVQSRLRQLHQKPIGVAPINEGTSEKNASAQEEGSDDGTVFLRQVLHSVISSLVEEWGTRGDRAWSFSGSSPPNYTGDASKSDLSKYEQENLDQQHPPLPLMEVVVSMPGRGIGTVRLTQSDIARLMRPS